jgi:hypothetical protein
MEGSITLKGAGFDGVKAKLDAALMDHIPELGEMTLRRANLTGHNRRSLTMDAFMDGQRVGGQSEGDFSLDASVMGVKAKGPSFRIYSQSGYGGYLELGTSKQQAQPHIYPAFEEMSEFLKSELTGVV